MFVPEWLDREEPTECNQYMLSLAQNLYDSMKEQVASFLQAYPDLDEKRGGGYSVRQELFSLVVSGHDPSGVEARCNRNMAAVHFLKEQNKAVLADIDKLAMAA